MTSDIARKGEASADSPGKVLDGLASQAEVGGRREHVAVIGPHRAFSGLVCRRKMDCARCV
jgi:hypothetical protein